MSEILIADDEDGIRAFLAEALAREGHAVAEVADGVAAIRALRDGAFDLLITDLRMPGADGMTVLRTVRTEQPDVEVIVLTAFGDVKTAVEAMRLGAFDFLEKPIASPAALRALVARALERRARFAVPSTPPRRAGGATPPLSWGAPAMAPVVDAIGKVARSAATVLLIGESGSGKEVVARTIHAASPRATKPLVAINCAVLSESLLESELFGHEKGSFTGAHALRRGRLELADGGTFFLDEVGELRPSLQAKLLRVLEERRFERVGGNESVRVDVRWIAATHNDLRAMVRAGTFREDLYHRLSVFPIRLPPLRERREDILPIAESLLAELMATAGRRAEPLDARVKARLVASAWPGNVRELRNVLERALILADGAGVRDEHVWIDPPEPSTAANPSDPHGAGGFALDSTTSLEALERAAIARALAAVNGNRKDAATRLGIGVRTLYEKLKRYDLK